MFEDYKNYYEKFNSWYPSYYDTKTIMIPPKVITLDREFPNYQFGKQNNFILKCGKTLKEYSNKNLYNRSLITGHLSGVTVLDIDYIDHFNELCTKYNIVIPNTLTIKTRRGVHLYFKYNNKIESGELFINSDKIADILNDKRLCMAPGSHYNKKGETGYYTIINDCEPAIIPLELEQYIITSQNKPKNKIDVLDDLINKFKKKHKDSFIFPIDKEYIYNIFDQLLKLLPIDIFGVNGKIRGWDILTENIKYYSVDEPKIIDLWLSYSKKSKSFISDEENLKILNNYKNIPHININFLISSYNEEFIKLTDAQIRKLKIDSIDYIKPAINNFSPLNINLKKTSHIQLNKDDLNDRGSIDKYNKYFDNKKYCFYISPPGTGKTDLTVDYLKNESYILALTSRITLAYNIFNKFTESNINIKNYKDSPPVVNGIKQKYYKLICQLDSLLNYKEILNDVKRLNKTNLYIDEIESFLYHLLFTQTQLMKDERKNIISFVVKIIRNCKKIICTDADISDFTLDFFDQFINNNNCVILENANIRTCDIDKEAYFYNSQDQIIEEIIKCVNGGGFPWICCDQKKMVRKIYAILNMACPFVPVIKYSKADGELPKNINTDWQNKVVIISPKIIYGLDFKSIKQEKTFSISSGRILNACHVLQQIMRNRNFESLHICLYESSKYPLIPDKIDFTNYLSKNEESIKKLLDINAIRYNFQNNDEEFETADPYIKNMYYTYLYTQNIYSHNTSYYIKNILKKRGLTCRNIANDEPEKVKNYFMNIPDMRSTIQNYIAEETEKTITQYIEGDDKKLQYNTRKYMQSIDEKYNIKTLDERKEHKYIYDEKLRFEFDILRNYTLYNVEKINNKNIQELELNIIKDDNNNKIHFLKLIENKLDNNFNLFIPNIATSNLSDPIEDGKNFLTLYNNSFNSKSKSIPQTKKDLLNLYNKSISNIFGGKIETQKADEGRNNLLCYRLQKRGICDIELNYINIKYYYNLYINFPYGKDELKEYIKMYSDIINKLNFKNPHIVKEMFKYNQYLSMEL